ncbi:MAG: hypothetical protein K6F99_03830 [Lachnospiraceae bacterium]|nr:hypothetical protein [Lachnospiraceae bacterium]
MSEETKKETEEVLDITEDELYEALVYTRSNGLLSVFNELMKEELENTAELSVGANGLPCIDATISSYSVRMSYFPVGSTNTDSFILAIRAAVMNGEEGGSAGRMIACESFNISSVIGTAVYLPDDGSVEYRISVPEVGGLQEEDHYRFLFDMLIAGADELKDYLED